MTRVLAQIAPQRSTQYSALASALAPHELKLCPLGESISDIRPIKLGGQDYLQFDLPQEPTKEQAHELGTLATISAFFIYYAKVGRTAGPLLRPIETEYKPFLSPELAMARRYRGKTNELFTHFMCNVARFSSALAHRPWETLRIFDPLAGGGTTLLTGLVLGASVAGVEKDTQDVESMVAFIGQYMREQSIPCTAKEERLKKVGKRWLFKIGLESPKLCMVACGDTTQSAQLIAGFRPHLIVADLPYGIQHQGELTDLLTNALPVWSSILPPGGTIVLAWESSRFPRADMIALVESLSQLTVLNDPPYDALVHRVDRVIKQRDVLVARPTESLAREQSARARPAGEDRA